MLIMFALCNLLFIPIQQVTDSQSVLLTAKTVFVEKADHDVDVAMLGELKEWGRWKIVADETEADLVVRLRISGSAVWGVGHVQASILDAKTKKTLYTSKEQRGTRTIFHGYASPYRRAISGIVKQMRKDIENPN